MAFVGAAEGLIALMIIPAVDVVLNPHSTAQTLTLMHLRGGRTLDLNQFFPHSIHHVWTIFSLSLFAIFFSKALAEFLGSTAIQYVGHAGVMDLRNRVYSKLVQQPIGFFQHNPAGRLMSAVINDVEQVRSAFSEFLADFFRQTFALIAFILVLLTINWKLALGSAVFIPLVVVPIGKLGRKIRRSSETSRVRLADLSHILQETITGNRVVKAFGMERFEIGRFREAARHLLRENMRWVRAYVATSPIMDVLAAVVFSLLILYARDQIKHNLMTQGMFFAFVYSLFKVYEPVKRLGGIYQLFQQAFGASTVVFQFLDLPQEASEAPGAAALPAFSREVKFENLSFAYDGGPTILHDINLAIPAGRVMAIVGSSGAGKTTLVNLLPRFHSPTSGGLLIDGWDVREVTLRSLREQMAIVTQETILFNDTVWNNLCYGRPDLPEARVVAAAKAALAHEFITQLPQGYQTRIGDRGQRLSGGQRQRLAIARALLKDAPILILDEATSELDSESEHLVQRALNNLMTGRTVFVIAHRLSTIRRADMIAVLDGGTIRELGTHEELLAKGTTYRRLYEMQFLDADMPSPAPGPM
jgi:ATP-binding cassette, subfamily B, bacterial MsbA